MMKLDGGETGIKVCPGGDPYSHFFTTPRLETNFAFFIKSEEKYLRYHVHVHVNLLALFHRVDIWHIFKISSAHLPVDEKNLGAVSLVQ